MMRVTSQVFHGIDVNHEGDKEHGEEMVLTSLAVNRRETEPVRVKYNGKRIT